MKNLLIVEDDDFKYQEIMEVLHFDEPVAWRIERADSVATAINLIHELDFERIILDMAIPSHPRQRGAGTALNLAVGGLEVLFEMESLGKDGRCIILTQFPEIEIEQSLIVLSNSKSAIKEKFQCNVIDCLLYSEEVDWKKSLLKSLN